MAGGGSAQNFMDKLTEAFAAFDDGSSHIPFADLDAAAARAGLSMEGSAVDALERAVRGTRKVTFPQFVGVFPAPEAFLNGDGPQLLATMGGTAGNGQRGALDEGPDERVLEFLVTLEDYRTKCEVEGSYEEAARCSDQLVLLRKQEEARRVAAWKSRHVAERTEVATQQANQFRDFNGAWDRYLSEYDSMAAMYVGSMQTKHAAKLQDFQEALHQELVKKPLKFGREILDWRSREAMLVKQRKYGEAARIKAVADELETRERARLDEERISGFALREAKYRSQQRIELEALLKRIETRRADHVKQRATDSKRLLQRNKNVMAVLEGRQASEEREVLASIKQSLAPPRSAIIARAALSSVASARAGSGRKTEIAGSGRGSPAKK